jgi:hypothetical protein
MFRQPKREAHRRAGRIEILREVQRALDAGQGLGQRRRQFQRARGRLQAGCAAHEQLVLQQQPQTRQRRAHRGLGAADAHPGARHVALADQGVEGDQQVEVYAM